MSLNMWSFADGDMQVFHQQVFTTLHHTINVAYHFQNVSTRSGCLQWGFVVRMGTLAVYRSRPDPRERRAPAVWFPLPVPLPAPPPKGNSASAAFQLKTSCWKRCCGIWFGNSQHFWLDHQISRLLLEVTVDRYLKLNVPSVYFLLLLLLHLGMWQYWSQSWLSSSSLDKSLVYCRTNKRETNIFSHHLIG